MGKDTACTFFSYQRSGDHWGGGSLTIATLACSATSKNYVSLAQVFTNVAFPLQIPQLYSVFGSFHKVTVPGTFLIPLGLAGGAASLDEFKESTAIRIIQHRGPVMRCRWVCVHGATLSHAHCEVVLNCAGTSSW